MASNTRASFAIVQAAFVTLFAVVPVIQSFAPGRFNLIGEHIDYHGGLVYPAALEIGTTTAISLREDGVFHIRSAQMTDAFEGTFPAAPRTKKWYSLILGVVDALRHRGLKVPGFNLLLSVDQEMTAGLSRSASITVAAVLAILKATDQDLDYKEIIDVCMYVEDVWMDVQCGPMDPAAILLGKEGHVTEFNCKTYQYRHIPVPAGMEILIAPSGETRGLGKIYNNLRARGDRVLAVINQVRAAEGLSAFSFLVEAQTVDVETVRDLLKESDYLAGIHVTTESLRCNLTVAALEAGDLDSVGYLVSETHRSLKDRCGVSTERLDLIAATLRKCEQVLGARFIGGGLGGSVMAIGRQLEAVRQSLDVLYRTLGCERNLSFITRAGCGAYAIPAVAA